MENDICNIQKAYFMLLYPIGTIFYRPNQNLNQNTFSLWDRARSDKKRIERKSE